MSAVTITEAAQVYLAELLEKQSTPSVGIRIFIAQPGTQHAEACTAYYRPGEKRVGDTVITLKDFTAWIDVINGPFPEDAVVDYTTDHMDGRLTIRAPNVKVPMVNGDNPITERINYYLQTGISPGLAGYGGQVSLVDVVEDSITVLRSGDGYQDYGMVDITFRDDVEKTLIERTSELKGARDVTDHSNKENVYY